jgi:hypothetical protein
MKELFFLSAVGHSQVTSSAMSGAVKSATGELLPSYGSRSRSQTTATKYYSTTDSRGGYGPGARTRSYIVKVTYVGYQTEI